MQANPGASEPFGYAVFGKSSKFGKVADAPIGESLKFVVRIIRVRKKFQRKR